MNELMQRFGLWFARWAGWSEQAIVAPFQEIITRQTHALADLHQELAALNARMATAATVTPSVLERATQLTSDADTTLVGGEAKRHAVYANVGPQADHRIGNSCERSDAIIEFAHVNSPVRPTR